MAELTAQDIAQRLMADRLQHSSPAVQGLTDPIADTPMTVTLEQLRPYELNPRTTRNPRYDEIKASIRERGLDAPPPITRRPGSAHYIVRNGGNTRLAILGELWSETREERFYRITCLFRPWTTRGEIVALTGHLAENELHGSLSFIERAVGIQKAHELYEQEGGRSLTQRELARRLTTDGFPVSHSQISRMQDAIEHLLPAIPSALYAGLGRPQIVRLLALRSTAEGVWTRQRLTKPVTTEFPDLFQEVLAPFDGDPETFRVDRVRDELIGQMSRQLEIPHLALAVEFGGADWRDPLARDPEGERAPQIKAPPVSPTTKPLSGQAGGSLQSHAAHAPSNLMLGTGLRATPASAPGNTPDRTPRTHSPPPLEMRQQPADPTLDDGDSLRRQISRLAQEIAQEGEADDSSAAEVRVLLDALRASLTRLSDASLCRLLKMIELTRRLRELASDDPDD